MFRTLKVVAVITTILSLSILGWHGFGIILEPPLDTFLSSYEEQVSRFFRLFEEPLVRPALNGLSSITGWSLTLHPHWKHIVILLWLNIGAESRNAWVMRDEVYSLYSGAIGMVIALIAGAASGVFDIDKVWSNALVALFPMFGYLLWAFAALAFHAVRSAAQNTGTLSRNKNWWRYWWGGIKYSLMRFGAGLAIIAAATIWSILSSTPVTGLAMLGVWVAFLALYWLATGLLQARDDGTPIFHNADFRHGWIMITTIGGAIGLLSLGVVRV